MTFCFILHGILNSKINVEVIRVIRLFLEKETYVKKKQKKFPVYIKAGHIRTASETPFEWRFAGGPIVV